jgi:hypothetical protein
MKINLFSLIIVLILFLNLVSAEIPFFVKPLENGEAQSDRSIKYEFSFASDLLCSSPIFSNITTIRTNKYGEGFYSLSVPILNNLLDVNYICQYRDNLLKSSTPLTDSFLNRLIVKNITTRNLIVEGNANFSLITSNEVNASIFNGAWNGSSLYYNKSDIDKNLTNLYVPYNNANSNVNLGNHNITTTGFGQFAWIDKIEQAAAPSTPPANTLRLYVEQRDGFSVYKFIDDTGMIRELVRDSVFIVRNNGANIPKMTAVYDCGSSGNYPIICPAKADNISTSQVIGITIEAINTNSFRIALWTTLFIH